MTYAPTCSLPARTSPAPFARAVKIAPTAPVATNLKPVPGQIARAWQAVAHWYALRRTARELESLPMDLRKDLGWRAPEIERL